MKRATEVLLLAAAVAAADVAFASDPGFLALAGLPYFIIALFVTANRTRELGYATLLVAFALAWGARLGLHQLQVAGYGPLPYAELWARGRLPLLIGIVAIFAFGQISRRRSRGVANPTPAAAAPAVDGSVAGTGSAHPPPPEVEEAPVEPAVLQEQVQALTVANRTLQNRVAGQPDSITYLYTRLNELYSQNVQRALEVMLDSVRFFTHAQKLSIWHYDRGAQQLTVRAHHGWDDAAPRPASLPADGSIEGWVARNNQRFSVKMLLHYDNLSRMDSGDVIYSFPVTAGRGVWGVLEVEALPFEQFNTYTEQMLLLILSLAAPALEQALDYESSIIHADVNEETGLPEFGQFNRLLGEEVARRGGDQSTVSIILIELANYAALVEAAGRSAAAQVLDQLITTAVKNSDGAAHAFHYKETGQMALIYPDLDFDGASLFALNYLEWMTQANWEQIAGEKMPEVILGYSSLSPQTSTADSMMEMAENLLEMQKI